MIKKKRMEILGLGAGILTSLVANADAIDGRWYVAPSISRVMSDSDRKADDGNGFQLGLGKPLNESWALELEGMYDKLNRNAGNSYRQSGLSLDALYLFNGGDSTTPYALLGAGIMRTQIPGERSNNPLGEIGLGLMHHLTDNGLAIRGDVRYRYDGDNNAVSSQNNFTDWLVNIGLTIPLGAKAVAAPSPVAAAPIVTAPEPIAPPPPVAPAKPAAVAAPADSDGDGVPDAQDRCPNTPRGTTVNAQGCELDSDGDGVVDNQDRCPSTPAGTKVNAQGCELDSDGDGIVDSQDRCPNTSAGAKVNAQGCELDSDGDGVVDSQDQCPGTKVGAKVDSKGCVIPEVIILKGVNFATDSANLNAESKHILDGAADTLRGRPNIKVEVAGYTDSQGKMAHNERLSQHRADAVKDYLVSKGVSAQNISAKGYGPANPVADNGTADGRTTNRRVELHIVEQ